MSLYEQWSEQLEKQNESKEHADFFAQYLEKEAIVYKKLLAEKRFVLEGTLLELAEEVGMDPITFTGFIDGGNTSFSEEQVLEELEEGKTLSLQFVPEKLFYNMLRAKANWLYGLPEWDAILSEETRRDIRMKYNQDTRATSDKVGRNDPCPCGSGKKYKKCCGASV